MVQCRVQASASGEGKSDEEQPSGVEHEAAILSELAKIPSITGAWIGSPSEHGNTLVVSLSQIEIACPDLPLSFKNGNTISLWKCLTQVPRHVSGK